MVGLLTLAGLTACGDQVTAPINRLAAPIHPSADVSFAPSTGGYVAKGDVQTALGWNNTTFQKHYSEVSFVYMTASSVPGGQPTFTCEDIPVGSTTLETNTYWQVPGWTYTVGEACPGFVETSYSYSKVIAVSDGSTTTTVSKGVAYDLKQHNQVVGYNLQPVAAAPGGTLYVVYNGSAKPLPNTVVTTQ